MLKSSFKSSLACQNRTLAYFYSQLEQQKKILQCLQSVLPDVLSVHVRHCLIKDKKLLVYTDSAVWASQLRFYKKIILASVELLSKQAVDTLQIKIMDSYEGASRHPLRKANIPSADTVAIIRTYSLTVSDNQLKQAMLRLSATLERLSSEAKNVF
ncbi:MAG: DUF721 domain-containing protein [Methylovulum sp.]|nr:DUF721 domain-containing protein [Methylovulum sp.]